jgi:hypothetical protein
MADVAHDASGPASPKSKPDWTFTLLRATSGHAAAAPPNSVMGLDGTDPAYEQWMRANNYQQRPQSN